MLIWSYQILGPPGWSCRSRGVPTPPLHTPLFETYERSRHPHARSFANSVSVPSIRYPRMLAPARTPALRHVSLTVSTGMFGERGETGD